MRRWMITALLIGIFAWSGMAQASPYGLSGEWRMNANGWIFTLDLQESGNKFEGVMKPLNHQSYDTRVVGTIHEDGKADFARYISGDNVQHYVGYIFRGVEKHRGIAGSFTHNGPQHYGWFAERIGEGLHARPVQVQKLFSAVPSQSSANFKANSVHQLRVETTSWDRVPYHMTKAFTGQIIVAPGQRVYLAGDEAGIKNWGVDNFLYLEFRQGQSVQQFVIGEHEPVILADGRRPQKVGPGSFTFSPAAVDFAAYLPKNTPIQVKAFALDYGGVGWVSDVYLHVK